MTTVKAIHQTSTGKNDLFINTGKSSQNDTKSICKKN